MNNLWLKIKKNTGKILIFGIFAVFSVLAASYIYGRPPRLEVDFFDVGQGDAALIRTPGGATVLIDGGPDNRVLRRLGEALPFYARRIDYLIISHYHDDHVTGLIEVMRRYRVGRIIYGVGNSSTEIFKIFLAAAQARGLVIQPLAGQGEITLGPNCSLSLLNPLTLGVKTDANNSLVAKLACAGERFLFSGDNSSAVEKALLKTGQDWRAEVLKASHHGSSSANSEIFLAAVRPAALVISVGAANRFGHPNPIVLERAADLGLSVRRTDTDGSVRILSPP